MLVSQYAISASPRSIQSEPVTEQRLHEVSEGRITREDEAEHDSADPGRCPNVPIQGHAIAAGKSTESQR
jgi:hypothetical protein